MKKDFEISMPSPCSKSWNEMLPSENGRYCRHCQQEVIDFRNWTEADIAAYVLNSTDKVCGRLGATYPPPATRFAATSRFSLLTFLSITSVLHLAYARPSGDQLLTFPQTRYRTELFQPHKDSVIIRGQLVDKRNNRISPLPGTRVGIKDHPSFVEADKNGFFELKVPRGEESMLVIEAVRIGYEIQNVGIAVPKVNSIDIGAISLLPKKARVGEVILHLPKKKL